jgi:hypothetical protein
VCVECLRGGCIELLLSPQRDKRERGQRCVSSTVPDPLVDLILQQTPLILSLPLALYQSPRIVKAKGRKVGIKKESGVLWEKKRKKASYKKEGKKNDFFSECRTSYLHYTGGYSTLMTYFMITPPPFHGRFLGDFFRFFHLCSWRKSILYWFFLFLLRIFLSF